ncbi:MAG TPA: DUF3313 domain-containing protein [Bryobacteraceae bacterium]|nr:DUF3313 domain-containing protein [Bryobacteraceae bacterium]
MKKIPSGQQFSGFLKDYAILKTNPSVGGDTLTFVHQDKMKSLRRYVAIIVDPVDIYLSTDAETSLFTPHAREAVSNYFRHALIDAVEDAFPVVDTAGPLVLRLRAAVVGIDLGGELAPIESGSEPLKRALVLEKVGVEMELVDSQTGEQIAAYVDKERLGAGAQVGSLNFSREERAAEARAAFDEWAGNVRAFLDVEHVLSAEDAARARDSYVQYGR